MLPGNLLGSFSYGNHDLNLHRLSTTQATTAADYAVLTVQTPKPRTPLGRLGADGYFFVLKWRYGTTRIESDPRMRVPPKAWPSILGRPQT